LPILRAWFEEAEVAEVEDATGAEPRRGLGGPIELVVLTVCPAAGLDEETEDGTTVDLPRLELKGFDGAVNGLEVVDAVVGTLEVDLM